MTSLSRRQVLRLTGMGAAAVLLGGAAWQLRPTAPADFPDNRALPHGDGRRLLVVYASMMGSTGQQAKWMTETADGLGFRTQLARAEVAPGPEGFDAVLFGSAIRASRWLEPALDWAAEHGSALASKPHGLFQCSMTCAGLLRSRADGQLAQADKAQLDGDLAALRKAAPALAASPVAFFPGRLEFARLTPLLRVGYPFVSGSIMDGDHRRPDAVRNWVNHALHAE